MPLKTKGTKKEKLHVLVELCFMYWVNGDINDIYQDTHEEFEKEFDPKIPIEEQYISQWLICYLWGLDPKNPEEFDEWYKKYTPIIEGGTSVLRIIPELEKQV